MLKSLNIKNLVVIHQLSLELSRGLNLLTGETGAGKSIIVDAVLLLLGGRGGADMIRTGERLAVIEGLFELEGASDFRVRTILREAGLELEDGEDILLRREMTAGGRSRTFVNEQSVNASFLKALQPYLLEILGQGEQHTLLGSKTHLELLDSFAGCEGLRQKTAQTYTIWRRSTDQLRALRREESERRRLGEFLSFQISELDKAKLLPGEEEELLREKSVLAHAERASALCAESYAELFESDQSILTRLAVVRRRVQELAAIDGRVGAWVEMADTAGALLGEVSENIRVYASGIDFSAGRLGELEGRLADIERLKRKYGRDFGGLLVLKEELTKELEELVSAEVREAELCEKVDEAAREYVFQASRLTEERRRAAPRLEERMAEELRQLALERARFRVSLNSVPSDAGQGVSGQSQVASDGPQASSAWTADGTDMVEFFLSANVGENPRPLSKVASGGELSRLMLALRTVCGRGSAAGEERQGVTLIFDEVDAGIGGRTAEAVGRRLRALAADQQVLCVTHQPQIARFADHHHVVSKQVEAGRTLTSVREVLGDARIGELARMIGGTEEASVTRQTARWMLSEGNNSEALEGPEASSKNGRRGASKRGGRKHSGRNGF